MDKLHHQSKILGSRMAAFKSRCERFFAYPLATANSGLHPLKQPLSPFPRSPHILVVDDNPANLGLACELLEGWGITPMLAADGAEAVTLACGHDFDLILMDLQMPILDGLAATKKIRLREREQSCARATVLAYTSCALEHDVLLGIGAHDIRFRCGGGYGDGFDGCGFGHSESPGMERIQT